MDFLENKIQSFFITLIVAAASFYLNITEINKNAVATFYSPQTRFWELMSGGLLAWIVLYKKLPELKNGAGWKGLLNAFSFFGSIILIYGFCHLNEELDFPGGWALVPVLGTVLLIAAGPNAWINKSILSNRLATWFGLISFPLYLWHWPLLSFAKFSNNPLNFYTLFAILFTSIFFAWLTYKFIEWPIRFEKESKKVIWTLISLLFLVWATGHFIYKMDGLILKSQISPEYVELKNHSPYGNGKSEEAFWENGCFNLNQDAFLFKRNKCEGSLHQSNRKVFLLGDSHSAYLSLYFRPYLTEHNYSLYQYSTASCIPLSVNDKRQRCADINHYILRKLSEERPEYVVLFAYHMKWGTDKKNYGESIPYDDFIKKTVINMKNMGVKKIIFIGQIPTWRDSLPHALFRNFIVKDKQIPKRTFLGITTESLNWDDKLKNVSQIDGVEYISLKQLLCNQSGCLTIVGEGQKRDFIVFDYGHLTEPGAKYITNNILSRYIN